MTRENLEIENATLMFRNFAGEAKDYNTAGDRNFCVALDPETAERLKADGWNVRVTKPKDPEVIPQPYIKVKVKYDNYPPKVYLHSGKKTTLMSADTVNQLDFAEILNADVVISPYQWNRNGQSGITGYLSIMHVVIRADPFADKYADPDVDGDLPFAL